MLGKYLKFIRGGKSGSDKPGSDEPNAVPPASKPVTPPSSSLGGSIPLLDSLMAVAAEESIDTGHIAADNVVASIPEIETTG